MDLLSYNNRTLRMTIEDFEAQNCLSDSYKKVCSPQNIVIWNNGVARIGTIKFKNFPRHGGQFENHRVAHNCPKTNEF